MPIRAKIDESIAADLQEARDVYRRYGHPFCLLLIESSTPLPDNPLPVRIRSTDQIFRIDEIHWAILLRFVGEESGGYKAAENLLFQLETRYPSFRFSMGIACKDKAVQEDILTRALFALAKAKEHTGNYLEDDAEID
jgi:hypothetical protein